MLLQVLFCIVENNASQGAVDDRQLGRNMAAFDIGDEWNIQHAKGIYDSFMLGQSWRIRCTGAPDEHGLRSVEKSRHS